MTGAQHYREAERLLLIPADDGEAQRNLHAAAQVHATLALAAATAATRSIGPEQPSGYRDLTTNESWTEVTL